MREGCAVPLQVSTPYGISQPVTISIREGGGPCADPHSAGYGRITWEKTITTSPSAAGSTNSETETLTVSLQSSPGKQAPQSFDDGAHDDYFGPSCPVPGYRSLDAGGVTIQGPRFGPVQTSVTPVQEGQVSGLNVYRAVLPAGTIQPGSFSVKASGGTDVGAFQSSVLIGSEIHVTTALAG